MFKCLILWFAAGLWWLTDLVLKPKHLSCNRSFRMEAALGKFNPEAYQKTKKQWFMVRSEFGYSLSCELLEPERDCDKLAILCHGFSHSKYGSLIYAELFLQLGYKVLIYDHRNHGFSGKAFTTMGYFEKYDLKRIVDWCYSRFGPKIKLVTHGESMGGATVLMHAGIDSRIRCVISDCAYSDLKQLLIHQMKTYYHLPKLLIPVESLITYLRAGFWYREVSPIKVVSRTDHPVLFIHGKKDEFVPVYMAKQMYDCKKDKKAIYLVAGAAHAQSCLKNRSGYARVMEGFLEKYNP